MLIASLSVGDSLVTLVAVQPLNRNEPITYNLSFTDIPTDKQYTKSYTGEAKALYALAAWIVCDEPEVIYKEVDELRADPALRGTHMP